MSAKINAYNYYTTYGKWIKKNTFGAEVQEKPEKKENTSHTAKTTEESPIWEEDSMEVSPEGELAVEHEEKIQELADTDAIEENKEETQELTKSDEVKKDEEQVSERAGGRIGVNAGKRARQIAAAQNRAQVQQVLALLQNDLAECKAGLEKGWCDESEIAKVEALLSKANARLSQVPQKTDNEQEGIDAFALASLM